MKNVTPIESPLKEAALEYAARGFYIFPVVPNRKAPAMISDYYTHSSCDKAQIEAWWSDCPTANIGLDCGKSGIIAIDVDTKAHGEGHDGTRSIAGLQLLTGGAKAWDTLRTRSGSGGVHYLFEAPSDEDLTVKTGSNTFNASGIDTRAKGGYVVLPPSKVPQGEYKFIADVPLKPIPRKLLSKRSEHRGEDGQTDIERKIGAGERIGEGGRDNFLISYLGKFRDFNLEYPELRALVEAAYYLRCEPGANPFTTEDFDRLAKSAMKWKPSTDLAAEVAKQVPKEPNGIFNKLDESFAIPASDFLQSYEESVEWIVDRILPRKSTNMMSGPPKAGKSTLTRHLALSVAYGLPFLGRWKTVQSRVLYYTLQENKPHLKSWMNTSLAALGLASVSIPIDFVFRLNVVGPKAIDGLRSRLEEFSYGLVIIDMFGKFIGADSLDDYAQIDRITSAINELAQDTNTTVIWTHHEGKAYAGANSFAGAIGSQAIRGSVYTTLKTWKDHGRRYIASEQRDGEDIEPSVVTLNKTTNDLRVANSKIAVALTDAQERRAKLEALVSSQPDISAKEAVKEVGGRYQEVSSLLERIRQERPRDGK